MDLLFDRINSITMENRLQIFSIYKTIQSIAVFVYIQTHLSKKQRLRIIYKNFDTWLQIMFY